MAVTSLKRRELKVIEYRSRAQAAGTAAAAATLDTVRALHVQSELRWTELAEAEDARLKQLQTPLDA